MKQVCRQGQWGTNKDGEYFFRASEGANSQILAELNDNEFSFVEIAQIILDNKVEIHDY